MYLLQWRGMNLAISIDFVQQHNFFFREIINLPKNFTIFWEIETGQSFAGYVHINFTHQ